MKLKVDRHVMKLKVVRHVASSNIGTEVVRHGMA